MASLIKFIFRQHPPYFYVVVLLIAIVLTFFIQRYVYLKTTQVQQQKIKQFQQLDDMYQQLRTKNEETTESLLLKNKTLDSNKHELNLQTETIQQLEQQLSLQQEQLATLNKELLFYEAITQGDRPNKLQIRELHLRSDTTNSDIVHYRVVITQGKKINQALTGTIEMVSNMPQDKTIALAEHPLNLRHVQLIEGQIQIANNEIPDSITVTIKQKKKTLLSQAFNWQLSPPSE